MSKIDLNKFNFRTAIMAKVEANEYLQLLKDADELRMLKKYGADKWNGNDEHMGLLKDYYPDIKTQSERLTQWDKDLSLKVERKMMKTSTIIVTDKVAK